MLVEKSIVAFAAFVCVIGAKTPAHGVVELQLDVSKAARTSKILGELSSAEHMMGIELAGHPAIMKEEIQLLHGAEDAVRQGHVAKHSTELIQKRNNDGLSVGDGKILRELSTVEGMMKQELHGHPQVLQEEMQLLHGAEASVQHGHQIRQSAGLIQKKGKARLATGTGKILSELSTAESMMEKELHGHPKILQEEMQLLRGAESAVQHRQQSTQKAELLQQKSNEGLTVGTGKILGELGAAENMVKQALRGHPKELKAEEEALSQAASAARALQQPQRGALMELSKTATVSSQQIEASAEQLERQRSRSTAAALQEERSYGAAERQLSKEGEKIVSEFGNVEESIAQAFAGKDSKAVKTAMQLGEFLEKARDDQQKVNHLNADEAASAEKKAESLAAVFAQTTAESKAMMLQREYTTGMVNLAKEEKSLVTGFSGLKSAVAQAFAGQDGKAVEKAMQVGELLDQARGEQTQMAEKDAKLAADAKTLFHELSANKQRHRQNHVNAFLQK